MESRLGISGNYKLYDWLRYQSEDCVELLWTLIQANRDDDNFAAEFNV